MITVITSKGIRMAISLHDVLHGFRQGREMGIATLEDKMMQHMKEICHEPLFQVLLDVKKAYYSLDLMCCKKILRGYEIGKNLQSLLE